MKKKVSVFVLVLGMMASFVVGTAASNGLQAITAYLNSGITIKLDGEAQVLTDASGARTYPISYNGTTYIPIRSVSNLLGVDVNWDQATQSVLLGKQPSGVDLIDTYKNYYTSAAGQVQTADKKTEDISGVTCTNWLYLNRGPMNSGNCQISFNLLGKYNTLTFSYYCNKDGTLKILGDNGYVLGEVSVTGSGVAKTMTIPLMSTSELTFYAELPGSSGLRIFNAYLDAEE